jgi:hypothetical protein
MGWRFRGLYTVATPHARRVLARDEVVAGTWAHLTPGDAPAAHLPRPGLLVVHGLRDWDAFWPRHRLAVPAALLELFDDTHRPPAQLLAWMHEFTAATALPIALYQCEMSGGLDLEIAFVTGPDGDTFTARSPTSPPFHGTREWHGGRWGRARTDPLQSMLRALGARPDGWVFPPHERPLPNPLRPAAAVLRRHSLLAAAEAGDADRVRHLLLRGADPAHFRRGLLPAAAAGGSPDAVGRLAAVAPDDALAHAPNPDCAAELFDHCTDLGGALLGVLQRGHGGTAAYLMDRGATADPAALWLSAAKGGVRWLVERLLAGGVDVEARGLWSLHGDPSALEWAAAGGHTAIVSLLLDAGATLTPAAVTAAARHARVVTLRTLLDRGGDPDAACAARSPRSAEAEDTALTLAAYTGNRDTTAMLLAAGADPATPTRGGVALHAACHGGNPAVVRLLLDAAPHLLDAAAPTGLTPLWAAVNRGSQPVTDLLLAAGADPAHSGGQSFSLAGYATRRGIRL